MFFLKLFFERIRFNKGTKKIVNKKIWFAN